jgi:hypothetical protein
VVAAGCAQTQVLNDAYKGKDFAGASVLVYPLFADQVTVVNTDDFRDDFEDVQGRPSSHLGEEINRMATSHFTQRFARMKVMKGDPADLRRPGADNSLKISETLDKRPFEIRLPSKAYLETQNRRPTFAIVLDQVIFSRDLSSYTHTFAAPSGPPGSAAPAPSTTSTKKSLGVAINYAIYDYDRGATVGYGTVKGEQSFTFAMTRSDWHAAIQAALAKIEQGSPFR